MWRISPRADTIPSVTRLLDRRRLGPQVDLEKEQLELFEILRKQEKDDKEQKERTKRERGPFPEPTYLKETESVGNFQLSPDRSMVTFILTDRADANKAKVP